MRVKWEREVLVFIMGVGLFEEVRRLVLVESFLVFWYDMEGI